MSGFARLLQVPEHLVTPARSDRARSERKSRFFWCCCVLLLANPAIKPQGGYTSSCVFYQPLPRSVCWSSGRSANGGDVKRDTLARMFELFRFPGGSRISPGNSHICPALLSNHGGFPVPVRDKPGGQLAPLGAVSSLPARRNLCPVRRLERCQNVDYK